MPKINTKKIDHIAVFVSSAIKLSDELEENPNYLAYDLSEKLKDCQHIINKIKEHESIETIRGTNSR